MLPRIALRLDEHAVIIHQHRHRPFAWRHAFRGDYAAILLSILGPHQTSGSEVATYAGPHHGVLCQATEPKRLDRLRQFTDGSRILHIALEFVFVLVQQRLEIGERLVLAERYAAGCLRAGSLYPPACKLGRFPLNDCCLQRARLLEIRSEELLLELRHAFGVAWHLRCDAGVEFIREDLCLREACPPLERMLFEPVLFEMARRGRGAVGQQVLVRPVRRVRGHARE